MFETTLASVFMTGLFGGLHCAGMCGGIVGALSYRNRTAPVDFYHTSTLTPVYTAHKKPVGGGTMRTPAQTMSVPALQLQLLYNTGRLTTYVVLGALAGSIGSISWWMGHALPAQQAAFVITNMVLVLMGLYLGGVKWAGGFFEILGHGIWQQIYPSAAKQLKASGPMRALSAGALWGLVPCGMLYGVLLAALVSGSAVKGSALMLAFGLGTLPSLLALGTAGGWLNQKSKQPHLRRAAGAVIVLFGVVGLLRIDAAERLPLIGQLCVYLPGYQP